MRGVREWMNEYKLSSKIAAMYFVFSFIWIYGSDRIFYILIKDVDFYAQIQTAKGALFLVVTSSLLWILVFREAKKYNQLYFEASRRASQYRSYFDQGIIGVLLLDETLNIIDMNGKGKEIFKFEVGDFESNHLIDVLGKLHIDDEQLEALQRSIETGDAIQLQMDYYEDDITHIMMTLSPIRDHLGEVIQHVAFAQQIDQIKELENELIEKNQQIKSKMLEVESMNNALHLEIEEKKHVEQSLNESERKMKGILNFLPEATFAIDLNGSVILWNKAMEELTGITSGEMIGSSNYSYAIPFYGVRRPMLLDLVLQEHDILKRTYEDFRKENDTISAIANTPHVDGRLRTFRTKAAPLYNGSNQVVGAIQSLADITSSISGEKLLKESERQFRTLIDQASVPIQIYSSDGVLINTNKAAERLWKTSNDDIINNYNVFKDKRLIENGSIEVIKHAFAGSVVDPFEIRYDFENISGEVVERWLRTRIYPIFDDDSQIDRVVMMHEDISELKEYENHMIKIVEERTKALEAISEVGRSLINAQEIEGVYDSLRESIMKMTGAEDFYIVLADIEDNSLNFVYDTRQEHIMIDNKRRMEHGLVEHVISTRNPLHLFGDVDYKKSILGIKEIQKNPAASWLGVPLFEQDNILGALCIQHTTNSHAFSEEQVGVIESIASEMAISIVNSSLYKEIQKEKTYFESLVKVSPVAIVTTDKQNSIIIWNPAAEKLFGYAKEDVVGKHIDDIVAVKGREKASRELSNRVLSGENIQMIGKRARRDGSQIDVEIIGAPVEISGEKIGQVATYHDISELLNARREAERANQHKGEFLANMSHEIRTPMNAIIGFSELAMTTDLNDRQADYIAKIQLASKTLLGIINDILDFSKIEAGKLELENIKFSLEEVVDTIATMISVRAAEKRIEFIYKIDNDMPDAFIGDPLRIGQILTNLSSNAVKFTNEGHIFINVELASRIGDRCTLRVSVADTGIGMSQDRQKSLFRAFAQADTSITRKYGGSGLGLAISKQLTEMMDGSIGVQSVEGKGSTFTFTVKVTAVEDGSRPQDALERIFEGKRALIVDDNELARTVIAHQLEDIGFETSCAASGDEAIERIDKGQEFDIILMDWQMPEMDGIETTGRIKEELEHGDEIKIVMITAFGREEIIYKAEEAGVEAVLLKPINKRLMRETLEYVIYKEPSASATVGKKKSKRVHLSTDEKRFKGYAIRILIVEDVELNQQILVDILGLYGIETEVASNGQIAIEKMQKNQYDLVFMDVQMPVMSGYEATALIRENRAWDSTPIVAMTAHATLVVREKCLESGMDDYMSKPITTSALVKMIEKWIPRVTRLETSESVDDIERKRTADQMMKYYVSGLNIPAALERMGGDSVAYLRILERFADDSKTLLEVLENTIRNEDLSGLIDVVHKIKGVMGNLSADGIYQLALELEESVETLNRNEMKGRVTTLKNHISSISESIKKSGILELVKEKRLKMTPTELRRLYKTLESQLEQNDFNSVETARRFVVQIEPNVSDALREELLKAVNVFDFTGARSMLVEIKSKLDAMEWGGEK